MPNSSYTRFSSASSASKQRGPPGRVLYQSSGRPRDAAVIGGTQAGPSRSWYGGGVGYVLFPVGSMGVGGREGSSGAPGMIRLSSCLLNGDEGREGRRVKIEGPRRKGFRSGVEDRRRIGPSGSSSSEFVSSSVDCDGLCGGIDEIKVSLFQSRERTRPFCGIRGIQRFTPGLISQCYV